METSHLQHVAAAARFDGRTTYSLGVGSGMKNECVDQQQGQAGARPARMVQGRDADWSGAVPRANSRKTFANKRNASSITFMDGTVVSAAGGEAEHRAPLIAHERDIRFSGYGPESKELPLNTAAYQMGPGSSHTARGWRSTYQCQFEDCEGDEGHRGAEAVGRAEERRRGRKHASAPEHPGPAVIFSRSENNLGQARPMKHPVGNSLLNSINVSDLASRLRSQGVETLPPEPTARASARRGDKSLTENLAARNVGYTGKRQIAY